MSDNSNSRTSKRKLPLDNDSLAPFNMEQVIKKHTLSKRVIEKLWNPLDEPNAHSLDELLNIALLKTLEHQPDKSEASKSINNAWIDTSTTANNDSFRSRLQLTKLPPPNSMYVHHVRNKTNDLKNAFDYDSVLRKKTVLETYLSAELSSLHELEQTYNQSVLMYDRDVGYFGTFKGTVKGEERRLDEEIQAMEEELALFEYSKLPDNIYLKKKKMDMGEFDPDRDDDTKEILVKLNGSLNLMDLKKLNEKLEVMINMLD
ncbi:hypothetical protein SBY92_001647 [Candida maltosa Xu316]|uniref:Uncharacterized protein n=1 Tax=Candida maltosa (strain Xu316) TaxID=1245528 RepID=M3IW58_CANMX|nr:hypothetical protein G210_0140 [Candida maltosa Xu316]